MQHNFRELAYNDRVLAYAISNSFGELWSCNALRMDPVWCSFIVTVGGAFWCPPIGRAYESIAEGNSEIALQNHSSV